MTNRLQSENNIVIRISTVIWELFFLNLLTLLCCLPILTIGASLTALFLAAARFPRTAAMTMMWILPVVGTKFLFTLPIVLLFGISLPAMLCALFYYPVFRELEETEET